MAEYVWSFAGHPAFDSLTQLHTKGVLLFALEQLHLSK